MSDHANAGGVVGSHGPSGTGLCAGRDEGGGDLHRITEAWQEDCAIRKGEKSLQRKAGHAGERPGRSLPHS